VRFGPSRQSCRRVASQLTNIDTSALTAFDWFLIALVAISTSAAFFRGFIKVLFSLAGLILGILLASWNYLSLATQLHDFITSFAAAQVVAFLLILCIVMIVFAILASVLRKAVSAVGLGFFDRLLGAAFGLPGSPWIKHSQLAPYFLAGAHAVSFVVPQHFQEQMSAGATHLLQKSPELLPHRSLPQQTQD
jgi:membrane protein required for colicin V production